MVMKQSMMTKNLMQSIRRSLGRYIAIAVIIALGAGMFVGLRSTKMDMVATGQVYTDKQNMFDLRLISGCGWGQEQVEAAAMLEGVVDAEGMYYTDLICNWGDDGEGAVYRFHTIPEKLDKLVLLKGRMPERPDECLADGFRNGASALGSTLTVADNNSEEALENVNYRTFTIVGIVSTPLYMDMNRGNTSVGSGNISNYFFVPSEAFEADYFTEIHVTIPGQYAIYSKEYNDAMTEAADRLKPLLEPLAQERLEKVRADARQELDDGWQEYRDGVTEYEEKKADAYQQMEDAFGELLDAEDTLRRTEQKLRDGEQRIKDGKATLVETRKTLAQSRQKLASTKASMAAQGLSDINDYMADIQTSTEVKLEVDSQMTTVNAQLVEINAYILQFEYGIITPSEEEKADAYAKQNRLQRQYDDLKAESDRLDGIIRNAETGLAMLAAQQVIMNQQMDIAEDQISAGEAQVEAFEKELDYQQEVLTDGWKEFEQGMEDYHKGLREYFDSRQEAKEKFDEAAEELADAAQKLADGEQTLADMTENDVYVLDRNTNMGYNSLDSSSDIVAGVSRVFPAFFLLVAALVCITTMTRMVDEERTQIGTLKALGYSSLAIMSKYLIYAGSSAVLGGMLGVAAGSIGFPMVLWEAYKIMLFIDPVIVLKFDWALAAVVLITYTAAMLLVTWYCCYRALEEVPAELIRPKAPTSGKELFFEKMSFWNNLSFLNKVAIRNIFRYRQRLAMMLLGIGGCTALLMTGYGLRDSISKIVDVQFREVMTYDMEVYFREGCDEEMQQSFRDTMKPYAKDILFFNQISGEISANHQTRDIYLISASDRIGSFWNFHSGSQEVSLPGQDEVLLSAGMADLMQISEGDDIIIRNPDMEELHLRVSAIYDNHVYNYAIISPETMEHQWGRTPELQMAFVTVRDGVDGYAAGAEATGAENVMNVTVSEQMADMVGTMMKALDLVVWVVVFCAALLAAIVLYNLTNINITERIREIATIKVLGFNAGETAMYVFKENLVLSVMGTVFGLPLGKLLLSFVISQIKIDMIWIKTRLEWPSLLISVVMTVCMAFVVDFIFYFKLDKINMAEALKSVE